MARYRQGKFTPINPSKYLGDPTNIIYRSSWELKFLKKLDVNSSVVGYASEEVVVPYISPIDNKIHRYFVDILVVAKDPTGGFKTTLIEIKPYAQTLAPKATKTKRKDRLITETMTYLVNQAKWKAAEQFCAKKGWIFKVVTEKDINF
jgi:hypothetical protein